LVTRVIAVVIGAFELITGIWSFLAPMSFFDNVANFAPRNIHLLHDVGAFQVGLGFVLILPVVLRAPLRVPLIAVLVASVLHLFSHVEDISLGGHTITDLSVLTFMCVALAIAIVMDVRASPA